MSFSSPFRRFRVPKPDPAVIAAIKAQVMKQLGAAEEVALAINEILCNDPGCPGIETVILIMEPGRKTRACKIARRLEEIDEDDIARALLSLE